MAERPKLTSQDAPPASFNDGRSDGAAPCHQDVASEQELIPADGPQELIPADGPQEISDNVFLCQQNEVLQARVMELEALLQEASGRQLWAAELAARALTPVMANDRHNLDSMAELQVLRELSEDSALHSDFNGQQILATPNQMHYLNAHSAITHDFETSALARQDIETCASVDGIMGPSGDAVDLSQRQSLERLQIDLESLRMQLEEAVVERDTLSLRLAAEVAKCNGLSQHLQNVPQLEAINEDLSQQLANLNERACELVREGEALRLERDDLLRQLSTAEAARMEWLSAAEAARMEMASAGERFQEQYEALQLEIMQPLSSETALHMDEGKAHDSRPLPFVDPQVPYVFQGGMADAKTRQIGPDQQEDKHLKSDLSAALAEADSLRADHRTMHAAHCSLQAAHGNLQQEHHDALATVGTLRALTDELKQQLLSAHAVAESECEGRTAAEALESLRISQAAESCCQEAETKVKEAEAQLAETLLAFSQLLTVHTELEKSHEDLKSSHHELESDHAQACEDMANLRDDHTRMLVAISDLHSKHAELEASHLALLAEHAELKAKHSNLEAEKSAALLSEVAVATENQGAAALSAGAHRLYPDIGIRAPDVGSLVNGRDIGDQIMAASSRPFHSRTLVEITGHIGTAIAEQLLALEEASQHMQGVDWCAVDVYCLQVMIDS